LGGNIRFARRAPFRADIGKIIDYQARELERHGVEVKLGSTVDVEMVRAWRADHVIVAAGARPRRDGLQRFHLIPVRGAELPHVRSPVDLGNYQAVAVAEYLLSKGAAVTFASSSDVIGVRLAASLAQRPTIERLNGYERFTFLPSQTIVDIAPARARLREIGRGLERTVDADLVVFCTPGEPRTGLHDALQKAGVSSRVTGDASGLVDLGHAIDSGREAALAL
jgi:hypothetical protein